MTVAADKARAALVRCATAMAPARRAMARAGQELTRAAQVGTVIAEARAADRRRGGQTFYQGSYFGQGRDPGGDRQGFSGYATYDRVSSNADIAAYLLWRNFGVQRTLDIGCAKGYLVEALRDLGLDAQGCDVSSFAVSHAAPGALGHVRMGDLLQGLPYADEQFDLVTLLETLEHLPPERVPAALAEARRVTGALIYATIPSIGANAGGPDGHFDGKVRPERLAYYRSLGPDFMGPVPPEDLELDADGAPIEGHLTIASFQWWTDRFAEAGFERWTEVEARLHGDIAIMDLSRHWNLYVFAVPGTSPSIAAPRKPDQTLYDLGLRHPLLEHARQVVHPPPSP
jgi:SAM-dependent methyltransferase